MGDGGESAVGMVHREMVREEKEGTIGTGIATNRIRVPTTIVVTNGADTTTPNAMDSRTNVRLTSAISKPPIATKIEAGTEVTKEKKETKTTHLARNNQTTMKKYGLSKRTLRGWSGRWGIWCRRCARS